MGSCTSDPPWRLIVSEKNSFTMARWICGRKDATLTTMEDVSRACSTIFLYSSLSILTFNIQKFQQSINRKAGEDIINPIQSARMRTINSFSFTYGTVEIRAKMPRGDWIWPGSIYSVTLYFCLANWIWIVNLAIWMMPTGNRFGAWPRSGEIDIVEIRSNNDYTCGSRHFGNKLMGSTLHFGI